jgi:phosphatidylglycerophosphatase A
MSGPSAKLHPRLLADPVHFVALGFGAGLSPKAPGTVGSLVALPFVWLLASAPPGIRIGVALAVVAAGVWVCGESARRLGMHDHPGIVFDEIAAMIALAIIVPAQPLPLIIAFGLFRFFDIVKPWPIRDLDHRLGGGLGIMLDDLMAAFYTGVCVKALFSLQQFA